MIPRASRRSILLFAVILPALAVPGVGPWRASGFAAPARFTAVVTGTATYRERISLPPGAVFEATLEEVSRADARAKVVARARERHPGQGAIAFELRYDTRRIDPRGRYVVRASIEERGRVLFSGSESYRPMTRGPGRRITVMMRRATSDNGGGPSGPADGLTNTRWRLVRVGNRDVRVPERQREPWIELDPRSMRVTGSGGCNRVSGTYESARGMLRFGPLMSTKMACISMDVETAFLRALAATRRYRVFGSHLELRDDLGRPLAQLEEANLR